MLFSNANTDDMRLFSFPIASVPKNYPGKIVGSFLNVHNYYSNLKYLDELFETSLKKVSSA